MKNFARSLTVKWRLVGFVCFLLILIIGAGLGGLYGMRSVNQSLSDVYKYQVLPFEELREIDHIFQTDIVSTLDKTLFGQISRDEGLKTIQKSKQTLDEKWAYLFSVEEEETGTQGNSLVANREIEIGLIHFCNQTESDQSRS